MPTGLGSSEMIGGLKGFIDLSPGQTLSEFNSTPFNNVEPFLNTLKLGMVKPMQRIPPSARSVPYFL